MDVYLNNHNASTQWNHKPDKEAKLSNIPNTPTQSKLAHFLTVVIFMIIFFCYSLSCCHFDMDP